MLDHLDGASQSTASKITDISKTDIHYISIKLSFNYHLSSADIIGHPTFQTQLVIIVQILVKKKITDNNLWLTGGANFRL